MDKPVTVTLEEEHEPGKWRELASVKVSAPHESISTKREMALRAACAANKARSCY